MPELIVPVSIAAVAAAYLLGLRRLWERAGVGQVTARWRVGAFVAGLALLTAAVTGPMGGFVGEHLWAHMVQHVVLVAVVAPLLVLGNPLPTVLGSVPLRHPLSTWVRRLARSHASASGWLRWVVIGLALQSAALWAWHAPGPYQASLRSPWVHGLEHLSFLGTATLFWWAVLGTHRRSFYGPGVLAVFFAGLQCILLGAFMTFASAPWYPAYTAGRGGAGLSPLQDQQVAGVIMWGPAGTVYLLAAVLLFVAWLGPDDQPVGSPLPTPTGSTSRRISSFSSMSRSAPVRSLHSL